MMTDRELLELAAKAAGYGELKWTALSEFHQIVETEGGLIWWNPLTDDGDALRLAVDLDFGIEVHRSLAVVHVGNGEQEKVSVYWNLKDIPDARTATRLAIVRAAAEIGKAIE